MTATHIPSAAASITRQWLNLVPPRACADCGVPLNRVPVGDDRDAYLVQDRVLQGSRPVLGHRSVCFTCSSDPEKARQRARRRRGVPQTGNFL